MKLLRLHLQAFGPFTDRWLDLGNGAVGLHLICGPNEAGKSSALRALTALRYGIEVRSTDDFVHDHPAMRLGALLLDRDGHTVSVVRRKGKGQTLSVRGPDDALSPASADLEYQLTGGLKRADFESLYALDHLRLRQGGEALLKGEGDVGAALFEASAGVRSLQDILAQLDQEARRHFVPGARGSKGRINEALRQHGEQAAVLREATLRPTVWAELQRGGEASGQALAALLDTQASLARAAREWRERLTAGPLLARLDQALQRCAALADAPVLGDEATARRLTLQASTAEHRQALAAVRQVMLQHQQDLDALQPSAAVLLAAAAIDRLVAEGERLDAGQRALRDAEVEQARLETQLAGLGANGPAESLLAAVPGGVLRAQADAALQALDEAERALQQHRAAMQAQAPALDPAPEPAVDALDWRPADDPLRVALRAACDAVVRADGVLVRLLALPAECVQARQRLAAALADLGPAVVWTPAAVRSACPVLEVDIDLAVRADGDGRTRAHELTLRLAQIEEALRGREAERDQLLAQGVVPTPDDVRTARATRDEAWQHWCADLGNAGLRDRVEQRVRQADALVDALVRDAGRAAQLQALQRQIADLVRDQHLRQSEIQQLQREQVARAAAWQVRLQEAGLPACSPEALREWQARLRAARLAADQAETLALEAARAEALAEQLRQGLRAVLDLPDTDTPLATLLALARQREDRFARAEQSALARTTERAVRLAQQARALEEEQRLLAVRAAAVSALAPVCLALQLPTDADRVTVRARLQEGEQLRLLLEQLGHARAAHARACGALDELRHKAQALAADLQDPPPPVDLRRWIDELGQRLGEARRVEGRRQVLAQALADARARQLLHDAALQQQDEALLGLCAAAGVSAEADLPAAEERARQLREARQQRDHVRGLLAEVSTRDEAALRTLVGSAEAAQVQTELERAEQALAALAPRIDEARRQDETARRARDAIDAGDAAAQARARMEQSAATVRSSLVPWRRARLAQALLAQALGQFRERAQGPMLRAASGYFSVMTGGDFDRLQSEPDADDHRPVLQVRRRDGRTLGVEGLSEGTRDQLYLALRLAALQLHRARGIDLPLVLDDVLMTSDDDRAVYMLRMLADFAQGGQVLVFTHHRHLLELARRSLPASALASATL
ncbi:ATP-binding protein [Sphaerotilus sp.]|uniref:ATP-binding protein n=1 Tax=Sphaerotilus sp. TaxID=2093942 RepID=UPI002ACE5907|nr:AAA family ATPase [Sphaerotilus sp.]MDZ7855571.1 AAA family ATPase [Sphaerotilus sp.]